MIIGIRRSEIAVEGIGGRLRLSLNCCGLGAITTRNPESNRKGGR